MPVYTNSEIALAHAEGILEHHEIWRMAGLQVDAQDVKPQGRLPGNLAHEGPRYPRKITLFVVVYGQLCGLITAGSAGLYFDEAECLAVPRHQVKFTAA